MSVRSIVLGLGLGLIISAFNYYVANILRAGTMTGGYFPLGVFGSLVVAVLLINPLLRLVRLRSLRAAELGVAAAIALAACTWPGAGLMQKLTAMSAWQPYIANRSAGYSGANLLSYFPGGRGEIAVGHVRNWPGLLAKLVDAQERAADPVATALWAQVADDVQRQLMSEASVRPDPPRYLLLSAINRALARPGFLEEVASADPELAAAAGSGRLALTDLEMHERERAGRRVLDRAWPQLLVPMPPGEGLMVAHGTMDLESVQPLALGAGRRVGPAQLPWDDWWPTLRTWGLITLSLAGASLCMALIVHRQWSQHELLTYPIARFVSDVTRREQGGWLPDIAQAKAFWITAALVGLIESLHQLSVLDPRFTAIPLTLNLTPLRQLFPTASRVPGSFGLFEPKLIPITIGLAFFLPRAISFSIGIGTYIWLALGSALLSYGVVVAYDSARPQAWTNLAAGAYVAAAVMVVYLGRAEYSRIALAAAGLGRRMNAPLYAVWAMRSLVLCAAVLLGTLVFRAGMDWLQASLLVLMMLLILLVLGRMTAEAGLYMATTSWEPTVLLFAFLGPAAVGPAATVVVVMLSKILLRHDTLMPLLVNALKIGQSPGDARPGRLAPLMALMLIAGLVVALLATLSVQYSHGLLAQFDAGPNHWGSGPLHNASQVVAQLQATDQLTDVLTMGPLQRLTLANPDGMLVGFAFLGFAAFMGTAILRLRVSWWPLHPILFLFMGQWNFHVHAFSFLIGWMIKASVMSVAGKKGYDAAVPAVIGLVAGQLLSEMAWWVGGLAYALATT